MDVKNRLKVSRVANGDLTQQQLAEKVGCSRQTIHSIEKSKYVPSVELALKIAKELDTDINDIFYLGDKNGL